MRQLKSVWKDRRDYRSIAQTSEDVKRIVEVCAENGFEIDPQDAYWAWSKYSKTISSLDWVKLPSDYRRLLFTIIKYCVPEKIDEPSEHRASEYIAEYSIDGRRWEKIRMRHYYPNAKEDVMNKRKENPHFKTRITEFGEVVFELDSVYKVEWRG